MSLDDGMTSQKATKTCATIVPAEESNVKHTAAWHSFTLAATLLIMHFPLCHRFNGLIHAFFHFLSPSCGQRTALLLRQRGVISSGISPSGHTSFSFVWNTLLDQGRSLTLGQAGEALDRQKKKGTTRCQKKAMRRSPRTSSMRSSGTRPSWLPIGT